jgi:hypothetical protein
MEKTTKKSEAVKRDYDAYEQVMFAKAIRNGMTPGQAHDWVKVQVALQKRRQMEKPGRGNGT